MFSVMGLSWDQYTGIYYGLQTGSLFIIYVLLRILIPYDLIDWILKTIFFMSNDNEKDKCTQVEPGEQDKHTPTEMEEEDRHTPVKAGKHKKPYLKECICDDIWKVFKIIFEWKHCQDYACCKAWEDLWNWLGKHCRCTWCCDFKGDLQDKQLPRDHKLKLRREYAQYYCGRFIHLNLNKFGVYLLLCTCVWGASVAFFEAVILGYAVISSDDTTCPIPGRATKGAQVDCFIYKNSFDSTPNKTFPISCNITTPLVFHGSWAGCYAWIYADVEVVDVIEELGICSGIIAFIGSNVTIMSYLCRHHRWRLIYDILACLAIAAAPILIRYDGTVPFLTYVLLASLLISICITQYLLGKVPLLTGICVAHMVYKGIRNCFKSVTRSNKIDHNSEA
jgi:hypothetical protein